MPSQAKFELVAEVKQRLQRAKSVVVSDYRGLTVAELTSLRARLREQQAELAVIKNRLAKIALKELGMPAPDEHLLGPSCFTFSYGDPVAGPKVLSEYAKDHEKLAVKCGLFEGRVMDVAGVKTLATLPSREALLSRLLGDLKGPTAKLAMAIKGTVNKVAYVLQAVAKKKEEAGAAAPAEAAAAGA